MNYRFPLPFRPKESWHEAPRSFGSDRDGGARKHAGCDLYAPVGTPVLAVALGKVVQGPYLFYGGTYALEVDHGTFTVRYGEMENEFILNVTPGAFVRQGQVIGHVGQLHGMSISMLHFELFTSAITGPLTDFNDAPFKRRSDLMDPTKFLDECTIQQMEA